MVNLDAQAARVVIHRLLISSCQVAEIREGEKRGCILWGSRRGVPQQVFGSLPVTPRHQHAGEVDRGLDVVGKPLQYVEESSFGGFLFARTQFCESDDVLSLDILGPDGERPLGQLSTFCNRRLMSTLYQEFSQRDACVQALRVQRNGLLEEFQCRVGIPHRQGDHPELVVWLGSLRHRLGRIPKLQNCPLIVPLLLELFRLPKVSSELCLRRLGTSYQEQNEQWESRAIHGHSSF